MPLASARQHHPENQKENPGRPFAGAHGGGSNDAGLPTIPPCFSTTTHNAANSFSLRTAHLPFGINPTPTSSQPPPRCLVPRPHTESGCPSVALLLIYLFWPSGDAYFYYINRSALLIYSYYVLLEASSQSFVVKRYGANKCVC